MASLFEPGRRYLRWERNAGVADPPVPRDRLLKPRFRFPQSPREEIVRAIEVGHLLSEGVYAGDGCWDCPGDYPNLVHRAANRVLGYIAACRVLGGDVYRRRALEGLEHLLRTQCSEGDFPCFDRSHKGIRGLEEGLFETAAAGRALLAGYQLTWDTRFLDASRAAADWERACPPDPSVRDSMAAVSHLAAQYEATSDERALESAIERAGAAISTQLPFGGWSARDSWIWNHGVIARGLADLLRVLPAGHSLEADLRASLIAALNRAVRLQAASGEVMPNPRVRVRGHMCAQIMDALVAARPALGDALDNCIRGIARYRLSKTRDAAFARAYGDRWRAYSDGRTHAREAATGDAAWTAQFGRFAKDAELGEVAIGAFASHPPGRDPGPRDVQWAAVTSERTGGGAQEIAFRGGSAAGGIGWAIPEGMLTSGRRCRFTASVRCSGDPRALPAIVCSVYAGSRRREWDPITDCEFTRENPTVDSYSNVSVCFTASREAHYVYVWTPTEGPASMAVDEAVVVDAGRPLPDWSPALDAFDRDPDLIVLVTAGYLVV